MEGDIRTFQNASKIGLKDGEGMPGPVTSGILSFFQSQVHTGLRARIEDDGNYLSEA